MPYIIQALTSFFTTLFHLLTARIYQQRHPLPSPSDLKMKHIVIIGGSFAGVGTAHRILKQAAAAKSPHVGPFKVTLVSRDSHFYWNIAAPRAVVPGQFSDEHMFKPVADGFARYPAERFEFVLGSATGVDTESKVVRVAVSGGGETKELQYDYLVIATGAHTKEDSPFKSLGSTEATRDALHAMQAKIAEARTIVIAGAGLTGVETAGEIMSEYGRRKTVILVSCPPPPELRIRSQSCLLTQACLQALIRSDSPQRSPRKRLQDG